MENKKTNVEKKGVEKVVENTIIKAADKGETLTILLGEAPKQLELHPNKPIVISGAICSPRRFCEVREFERKKSHALVNLSKGEIKLIIDEQATNDKFEITGKIAISKEFESLGINGSAIYTPEELAKKLKLKRNIFANKLDHATTIANLRNIKAKVNQEIEKAKDDKANVTDVMIQSVESNCPDSIKIKIPLIEGGERVEIELFIVMEVDGGKIICSLESIDGAELIEEFREKAVQEEVEKIKDRTTIIYI